MEVIVNVNENNGSAGPVPIKSGWQGLDRAEAKLMELFRGMADHNGFSELRVEVNLLKKGKKDVVLFSGKQYHFVLKPINAPAEKEN